MGRRYAPVIAAARTAWRHSPPGLSRGALFLETLPAAQLASAPAARRPSPVARLRPSEPLRHLFEKLPLVVREALDALLGDLVEHAIQLVDPRFSSPRRRRDCHSSLRRDRLALGDDVVDFVSALAPRHIPRNRA